MGPAAASHWPQRCEPLRCRAPPHAHGRPCASTDYSSLRPALAHRVAEEYGSTSKAPVYQNARAASGFADRGFLMETGRVALPGSANQLPRNPQVRQA